MSKSKQRGATRSGFPARGYYRQAPAYKALTLADEIASIGALVRSMDPTGAIRQQISESQSLRRLNNFFRRKQNR